jgi:hypothetical protein
MRFATRLTGSLLLLAAFLWSAVPGARAQDSDFRLYGTITTTSGDAFEGLIRWDENEVSWLDILDGSKEVEQRERDRGIRIAGIRIGFDSDETTTKTSGLRMGHIARLEVTGSDDALLTLRSGERLALSGGSGDIGNDNRGITVEDANEGTVKLEWRDIEAVDFEQAPRAMMSSFGERLYGTLTLDTGDEFSGFIAWDLDETFTQDILDGEDETGREREIPFGSLQEIRRESSRSATVIRPDGRQLTLSGSNDVNSSNRDILVLDPSLGQIRVDWDDFDRLVFEQAPQGLDWRDFRGGALTGTVYTQDGERLSGQIAWDQDESNTWELLDGNLGDVELKVEFGLIAEIHRIASSRSEVRLRDGRVLRLSGSNDVDDGNDGIAITRDGETIVVDWQDFDYVVFDKP